MNRKNILALTLFLASATLAYKILAIEIGLPMNINAESEGGMTQADRQMLMAAKYFLQDMNSLKAAIKNQPSSVAANALMNFQFSQVPMADQGSTFTEADRQTLSFIAASLEDQKKQTQAIIAALPKGQDAITQALGDAGVNLDQ